MCRPLAVTVGLWCQGERWAGPHASICYSRRARGGWRSAKVCQSSKADQREKASEELQDVENLPPQRPHSALR